ncbi:MAG TPA: hypothetical protein VMM18_06410 [Gemmatimonadaceae bacterium]|nr:hypothetical protein [Gemmatimonadaceae bacterium]
MSIVLTGCFLSLHPVVTTSDAIFDPRLLGRWELDSGVYAVITRADSQTYEIRLTEDGLTGRFEARLGQLGGRLVLELQASPGDKAMQQYAPLVIRGHFLYVIELRDDELRLASFDREAVRSAVRQGEVQLEIIEQEDTWMMLDDTRQLRTALGALLSRTGMLDQDDVVWHRATNSGGN